MDNLIKMIKKIIFIKLGDLKLLINKQLEELADKEANIVPLYNSDAMKTTINSVLTKNVRFRDFVWFLF